MSETVNLELEVKKQSLLNKINECELVLSNLTDNPGYVKMIEDFVRSKEQLDNHWHLCADPAKLAEMRVTKMAVCAVVGALDNYKFDRDMARKELTVLENPDAIQAGDYPQEVL